jgi:ComF family protein
MMAMQFIDLGWPIPDLIVPVPISWTHWLGRGYNQSLLLAEVISSILGSPVKDIIKRQSGDYSQAGLSRSSRLKLSKGNFSLKPNADVADRVVLLIDDVMTTGSTLRRCAEQLLIQCPREIYALTLCCAE